MSFTELPPPALRRAIRRAAGRSMQDLATALSVTRQSISFWERGLIEPTEPHATQYARLLDDLRIEAAHTLADAEAALSRPPVQSDPMTRVTTSRPSMSAGQVDEAPVPVRGVDGSAAVLPDGGHLERSA